MGTASSLAFVLPFWNEIEGAERTVRTVEEALADLEQRQVIEAAEVVAVDDGSTDGTGELLDHLAEGSARLRVVHQPNGGLGAALRTGFREASTTWIFYTDADLPVDPLVCERALRAATLHDADIIACYRLDRTGEGLRREVLSAGYNAAVRAVTRLSVRDVNFAAKLVRREAVVDHLPTSDSLFFDAELLARAMGAGATLQQIGVDYFPRSAGTSSLSSTSSIVATARDLARLGPDVRLRRSSVDR
ncbi:MAG: glycosyltransferase family 2 protein [Aquihabitans sp.]